MKRKIPYILRNPLIAVPPFVVILGVGWQQYTYAGRDLSMPTANLNLLPNSDLQSIAASGLPVGWQATVAGAAHYAVSQTKGYTGGASAKLAVTDYQNGNVTLTTPRVNVGRNKTYLFKSYYTASTPFALLLRTYFNNGSSTVQLVRTYPNIGTSWSTVSDAFKTTSTATSVQIIFRMYANGSLALNGPYLEPQEQVSIAPSPSGSNMIPNNQLAMGQYYSPSGWSTYDTGNNTASFTYGQDESSPYVQTEVSNYADGQAKWQYAPQPVTPGQYYNFSIDYKSDALVPLVAEYQLQNGTIEDQAITTLPPADDWTTTTQQLQVPPEASAMFVTMPLEHNGMVATRDYTLINHTKPGAVSWRQPLVSLTFDDGWQTTYENVLPQLEQYGYQATFYVNPTTIETPNFMTATELDNLANNNDEIGANGYSHHDLTTLNDSALKYQLSEGRNYLQNAGFSVTDLATPYGRSDAEVAWYSKDYYTTVRGTDAGINTRQNIDPYNLKALYVTPTTTTAQIETALQTAKSENGWLVLVYHRIADEPLRSYGSLNVEHTTTTTAAFKKQLTIIHDSGVKVLPVSTAYMELQKL